MGREEPFYVTDSAASGTAWATGTKTGLFRISTAPFTGEALPTIAELAQKNGYRTGNVTTDSVTGATPAVQMAHVRLRNCESPADEGACDADLKSRGGLGSIAEQAADSRMDVILGGGLNDFQKTIPFGPDAGKTVLESAEASGIRSGDRCSRTYFLRGNRPSARAVQRKRPDSQLERARSGRIGSPAPSAA